MPVIRPLTVDLATALHSFYVRMPLTDIVNAIRAGKEVELEESLYTDPTDYCAINVDGRQVFYAPGY